MAEGYLRKWVNIMYGWKPRYFILDRGILTFCEKKGGKTKGTIYLQICTLKTIPEDPLRIIIHTGTNELHLRAETPEEQKKWFKTLEQAREEAQHQSDSHSYPEQSIETIKRTLSPDSKAALKTINLDSMKDKLAQLWVCQAEFDEVLSYLAPKVKANPNLSENMKKLEQLGSELKYRVTEVVSKVEEEKKKMVVIAKRFENNSEIGSGGFNRRLDFNDNQNEGMHRGGDSEESDDDDETVFQSFEDLDNFDELNMERQKMFGATKSVIQTQNDANSLVKLHLSSHPVFVQTGPIPKEKYREKMPYWLDPNQKLNIWSLVKDLVGKDLTRLAVPVWLNEPLSMLQKLCEQMEYSRLLDIGNGIADSCLRMAYVMGFAFGYYAGTIGRHKKPFNPILGETFEYVPVDGSFRFLSEQVSHHPPISAGFADSSNFQWWGDTQLKTNFKGASLDVKALGFCHAVLKKHDDHFTYKRPVTAVYNIIIGTMYVENFGEMTFQNAKTGDSGLLNLKKRGWSGKGAFEADGWIKDKNGDIKYTIHGKWNSYLTVVDANTKKEIKIWERDPIPQNYEQQYNFSNYSKQLNYLHEDLISKLPLTDCRLRPDQRALEYGLFDLARDEKHRLEEKQRARRKELQLKGETHNAKWFKEIKDPITGEKSFSYVGGYWECREKGNFGEVLDLF